MTEHPPRRGSRIQAAATAWGLTVATAVLYAVWLQGLPAASDELEFYGWAAGISLAPSLLAAFTLSRFRTLVLAALAAPATGFAVAYCLALLTYGSGAEDGTVWRGIGGAILGVVSTIWTWIVVRLQLSRPGHPRAS
ncbi:hypothetical protein [Aeromicrobium sp. Root344]|uniref:hypothetical protein n=1 Tax=Aeromicrobium sp. Root344 TaxID=1736521 RepID=UPI000AF3F420|nr:hypothetical protein [Aeromicrobium sp. Root344]